MRLRNIPGAKIALQESNFVISSPESIKDVWKKHLVKYKSLYLEIGCGRGNFIRQSALKNKHSFYIGLEKYSSVLYDAVRKIPDESIDNLLFIHHIAEELLAYFPEKVLSGIYLNFSDPWPKVRHRKRRLTHCDFLDIYNKIVIQNGFLQFKTDNKDLFEFSLSEIEKSHWNLIQCDYDFHNSDLSIDNIQTEYEKRYSKLSKPIYMLKAIII